MMPGHDCTSKDCEAHMFMVETVKEIKSMNLELMRSQQALEKSVIKLTENLQELQRMNQRIDSIMSKQTLKDEEQDKAIGIERDFRNRALGVLSLAIIVVPPFISMIIKYFTGS